jgi:hypothetical protein
LLGLTDVLPKVFGLLEASDQFALREAFFSAESQHAEQRVEDVHDLGAPVSRLGHDLAVLLELGAQPVADVWVHRQLFGGQLDARLDEFLVVVREWTFLGQVLVLDVVLQHSAHFRRRVYLLSRLDIRCQLTWHHAHFVHETSQVLARFSQH